MIRFLEDKSFSVRVLLMETDYYSLFMNLMKVLTLLHFNLEKH
jgi:hypothetical protein